MINKHYSRLTSKIIIAMILTLYIIFLFMDFYNMKAFVTSTNIKYLCVLLCFILSIISTKNAFIDKGECKLFKKDIMLLQLGMFITVLADLCLVILNIYVLGIVFFCMVQITYSVRYIPKKSKVTLRNFFVIFLCILMLYISINIFVAKINVLLPISLFYAICLITSVCKAIEAFKDNLYPVCNKYMVLLGMIFFLLCDICVALSNVSEYLSLPMFDMRNLEAIFHYLIWVFYVPSQLMISLSGNSKIKGENLLPKLLGLSSFLRL